MNKKEIYQEGQKFQIGDICKIVHTNNTFRYPPLEDKDDNYVGLYVIILGSYWQICGSPYELHYADGSMSKYKNTSDYQVIAPYCLNKTKCKKLDGGYEYYGIQSGSKEMRWAWVDEGQMEFVRHWNEDEYDVYIKEVDKVIKE